MTNRSLKKGLLATAGVVAVGLATVGLFLPLIPTTPFLLLAAACFVRSSDRLYRWLTEHRVFGDYIRNYREHGAVTRHTKALTLVLLWATMGFTALVVVRSTLVRLLLLAIAVGVTVHVLRLRTLTGEMLGRGEDEGPTGPTGNT